MRGEKKWKTWMKNVNSLTENWKEKSSKTEIQKLEEDAKKKDKVMREVQSVKRLKDNRLK